MKISRYVSYLFTVIAFAFSATFASAQVEWNHKPTSDIGPNFWGELAPSFATCGAGDPFIEVGKKQSPVDIVTTNVVDARLHPLQFKYDATPSVVENTGHVVEVPYEAGSHIRVGVESVDRYELLQFHFHAPSEHAVNGQLAAAEVHLVHRNALLDLAVVGVLINVGTPVNHVIDKILREAPLEEGEIELDESVNAKDLLPRFDKKYYHYSGSLTTPPCSEGVRWFVLQEPVFVSQEAIDRLHEVIAEFPHYEGSPNNNRPVRPLNGRAILK
ncbi:MAG: carbonic anhydrase [Candidatus Binatia bacterium]